MKPLNRVFIFLVLTCLLCTAALPASAFIYSTTLTTAQLPANYAGAVPTGGLFDACKNANNPNASTSGRSVVIVLASGMMEALAEALPAGRYYLGGFYNETTNDWCWYDKDGPSPPLPFGTGPTATAASPALTRNWSVNYPLLVNGAVGTRKYVVYDTATNGWMNVDGTTAFSGVACMSLNQIDIKDKSSFPWWAILIIVLGCVVVIAVVLTVVLCCCCKKKKRDDDDAGSFSSRSGSFSSRGTSYTGSSYTGTTRSSSFSSRGSSKGSSVTGSTGTDSSSTFSSRLTSNSGDSQSTDVSSTYSGSSVSSSSRGSSVRSHPR